MEGMLHSTISAFGGFYAIRKSLFKPIPPNSYSNDDVLIPMSVIRQKYRVIYEPMARSAEDITGNIISEFHRRIRIGAGNFQAFSWLIDFLNPFRGWPFFCFLSHKVSRWFSPFFFVTAAVSCLMLSVYGHEAVYRMLFGAGSIFLVTGFLHKVIALRITRHIYYFLMMNVALILGFLRFLRGIKSAACQEQNEAETLVKEARVRSRPLTYIYVRRTTMELHSEHWDPLHHQQLQTVPSGLPQVS